VTTSGELGPVLGSSVQEDRGRTGASPATGQECGLGIGASLIQRKAERAGTVQLGEGSGGFYPCV